MTIVQNEQVTVVLLDEKLIDFFGKYDGIYDLSFSFNDLVELYDDKADFWLEFLLKNKLASENIKKNTKINKIYFFIDSPLLIKSLKFNMQGSSTNFYINEFNYNDINMALFDSVEINDICYIVLTSFNYIAFQKLANLLREKNIIHKFVFYYNYCFYFTNYFKKEWHNPCPLCFFSHLEGSLRSEAKLNSRQSFQGLIDLIYAKTTYFNTEIILNNYKALKLINEISNDIQDLDEYRIKLIRCFNMSTYKLDYDVATHWDICDCNK